jgi:hypothetical protein
MAGTVAPNIVTDGLVLYLDAANTKSYVSGSTTWADIAAGNNGTLVNGPTYNNANGGSIVFDGVNDYINIADNVNLTNTSSLSINIWFKSTDVQSRINDLIGKGTSDLDEEYTVLVGNTFLYFDVGIESGPYIQNTTTFLNNVWYNTCCVHSRSGGISTLTGYVNGVATTGFTNNATAAPNNNSFPISIGKRFYNSNPYGRILNGNIAQISIYNRALSVTEVLQNYNALKGRFGL